MNTIEYIFEASKTDHESYTEFVGTVNEEQLRLLHYSIGVVGEATELQDIIRKGIFYRKCISAEQLKLEAGDVLWFLSRICSLLGTTFEELMEMNIKKLRIRYGEKWNQ